jgi:hypothetical protein
MNCQNLQMIITELAREQMLDARVREDALAHIETCGGCAARFDDERSLTAGLQSIARSSASSQAPARVEAALLSAFRQREAAPFVPANIHAQTVSTRWLPWSIAAAAAILIFSVFALPGLLPADSGKRAAVDGTSRVQTAPGVSTGIPTQDSAQNGAEILPEILVKAPDQESTDFVTPASRSISRRRALMQTAVNRQGRNSGGFEQPSGVNEEITTDFIPVSYGSNLSQMGDGQVVRIELPRSALQSFGLPVNAERSSERVKADVLMSHDGIAQAIRFVR